MHLELLLLYTGGTSKRQFAPRFINSARGTASDRSADGHIADVSAALTLYLIVH